MIIAFEGIGGSGKTTQIELLRSYFEELKKSCIVLKGGGTGGNTNQLEALKLKIDIEGDQINKLLKQSIKLQLQEIQRAVGNYDFVILDRTKYTYEVSALSKNKEPAGIFDIEIFDLLDKFPNPDITFLLKISATSAHNLMKTRSNLSAGDLRATIEKDEVKMRYYLSFANTLGWIIIDEETNGKLLSKEAIHTKIVHKICIFCIGWI